MNMNSFWKRVLATVLTIVLMFTMFPAGAISAETTNTVGTVKLLTASESAEIAGEVITYKGDLKWVTASGQCPEDGWWVGIDVTAPAGMDAEYLADVQYTSGGATQTFGKNRDTDTSIQLWGQIKPEHLKAENETGDGYATYSWSFDWDKDGGFEQTFTLRIDAGKTRLLNSDGTQAYPYAGVGMGTVAPLSGSVTVAGSGTELVTATSAGALNWVTASGQCPNDGWWVGINLTAPENLTAADLADVKYISSGTIKDFAANRDTDTSIQLWGAITKEYLEAGKTTYTWKFDWNKDGLFEQTVCLKFDAGTILKDSAGVQVYPLGKVSSFSGGTITGLNSAETVVTIKEVTLEWVEKNEAVGRGKDGWWVGAKVVAPTGASGIQYRHNFAENWAAYKPDGGTTDTMELWGLITPQYLKDFKAEGKNLNYIWEFDWDGNGIKDQTVKITVDPAGVTLTNSGFAFAETEDTFQLDKNDNKYVLKEPSGAQAGTVTYSVDKEELATVDNVSKTLIIKGAGEIEITATLEVDGYVFAPTSYKLIIEKGEQSAAIAEDESSALAYTKNDSYALPKLVNVKGNPEITYSIDNSDVAELIDSDGVQTIRTVSRGSFVLDITVAETANYKASTLHYEMTVEKGSQTFTVEDTGVLYGISDYAKQAVVDKVARTSDEDFGSGEYSLSVPEGNEVGAYIDGQGNISFNDNGKTGTVTVTITKAADDYYNSASADFTLTVSYANMPESAYSIVDSEDKELNPNETGWYKKDIYIKPADDWEISASNGRGDDWADKLKYDAEGKDGSVDFALRKKGDGAITAIQTISDINLDKTAPTVSVDYEGLNFIEILEGWFGFSRETVTVTFEAQDALSDVDFICFSTDGNDLDPKNPKNKVKLEEGKYSIELNAQYRNHIILYAVDSAGNTTKYEEADGKVRTVIVDAITPKLTIEYDYNEGNGTVSGGVVYSTDEVGVTFKIKADNFDLSKEPVITVVGTKEVNTADIKWTIDADSCTNTSSELQFPVNGDYEVAISFKDNLEREVNEKVKIHTDNTPPVIGSGIVDGKIYTENQTFELKVTEHNFDPAKVGLKVAAVNSADENVEIADFAVLAKTGDWTKSEGTDEYTLKLPITEDGIYTVSVDADDLATNAAESYTVNFTLDKEAPQKVDFALSKPTVVQKFLNGITFGFYKTPVKLELTAEDATSGVAEFNVIYTKEEGSSNKNIDTQSWNVTEINHEEETSVYTAEITLPNANENLRGIFSVIAKDVAEKNSEPVTKMVTESGEALNTVVVDCLSPVISVTYVSEAGANYYKDDAKNDASAEDAEQIVFGSTVTAKVTIDEANFFEGLAGEEGIIHNVGILLAKTDNDGKPTYIEYLPAGAEKKFAEASQLQDIVWKPDGDQHTVEIPYKDNADYVLTVKYMDDSSNAMVNEEGNTAGTVDNSGMFESKTVTVDTTPPEVTVEYGGTVVYTDPETGREYLVEGRTAKIKVTEHNFRASDMKGIVEAVNSANGQVGGIEDFAATMANAGNWVTVGNEHTLELAYTKDANYTFDYELVDLAKNPATDYTEDLFTVDSEKPENLEVVYSTDGVKWYDIFGFYGAKTTVTLKMEDATSGIHRINYAYKLSDNVSSVNAGLEAWIEQSHITHTENTSEYVATFEVPRDVLRENNQFHGTVWFEAFDFGKLSEETETTNRIIVDNISPKATVTYNAPVQELNGVSYYAGNIEATIVINEANFFSEDVRVSVTRNGVSYPVHISWFDNNADVHTGTFQLSEDGDYIVNVAYTDRSKNTMTPYTSNQLTIDLEEPVIQLFGVKHESANNSEKVGLKLQVTDRNLELQNIKPNLSAVVKKDSGNNKYTFETITIDLGTPVSAVNADGDTVYTYTVENLETDGFYSLTCEVTDHAKHIVSEIVCEDNTDESGSVETVNFSVNREGSVFWITTEHTDGTETIINQLDGEYVNGEVIVRIHEVNVDKVDEDKDTVFTLNDGSSAEDIVLDESNYEKNVSVGAGGWYETVYTLNNDYFARDGVYSVNIITYDKAGNSNINTKSETGSISFTVDRTKPVISANLTSRQIINDTQYKVYFQITELNLDAATVSVKYNGEAIAPEELGNNEYSFVVETGLRQSAQISAVDLAGNESEVYEADNFTVSTNWLVRWYATGIWFWLPIIGTLLLGGLIILLIVLKKKKKEER